MSENKPYEISDVFSSIGLWVGFLFWGVLLYWSFSADWLEYECVELGLWNGTPTGDIVQLYSKGGVVLISDSGTSTELTLKFKHEIAEGDKYKNYLRDGTYSYKLNKDDLTYHNKLNDRSAQCKKIGLYEKILNGIFSAKI